MKLRKTGNNTTEITLSNSAVVLFSYETPVAAIINGTPYKTSKKWSVTTSKHINQWLNDDTNPIRKHQVVEKEQGFFDELATVAECEHVDNVLEKVFS